jgi:hypothetical protein
LTGETSLEHPEQEAALQGELRRLPPKAALRIFQALTLLTLFSALARAMGRYTLGYRHRFRLFVRGREIVLEREHVTLGRVVRSARTVLPLDRLQEITLERRGEPPAFTAGLVALGLGTFVGSRVISEGVLASGGAPWLLGVGALLVLTGLLLDFFVGSGRTPARPSGRPELHLRVSSERGWVLAHVDSEKAEALLSVIEQALTRGERPAKS